MGMDLIGAGWTIDTDHLKVSGDDEHAGTAAVAEFMRTLGGTTILSHMDQLDYSGRFEGEDDADLIDIVRTTIQQGYEVSIEYGGRATNTWDIPGTNLMFVYMGGGSWGDDPFDGFDALTMFLIACEVWPDLGEKVGFVCAGLPDISTMILHNTSTPAGTV